MNPLETMKSFIGKEFSASPSPFMLWLKPVVKSVETGALEFEYKIRPEWLNPIGNLHGGVTAAIVDDVLGATIFSLNEAYFYTTINNVIDYFSIAKAGESIIAKTHILKKGKQFINNFGNEITNLNLGPEVRLDLNFSSRFYMSIGAEIRYSNTSYSLPSAKDATFLVQEYSTEINWELPARFFFNTRYTYNINTQQSDGFNTKFPLWNAFLSKQFLRYNRGELKITAFDIMNKNVGISRTANQNFIEDKRVNNLQQYFMLSFTYSLSKNSASSQQGPQNGLKIIK
ncbi:MAG: hypothetical protein EOO01_01240 [Chitinophagaceae bacterium]|nr:MAG: hypothetical protein EOO01_01240 [Chitinophagaceae bacterium]